MGMTPQTTVGDISCFLESLLATRPSVGQCRRGFILGPTVIIQGGSKGDKRHSGALKNLVKNV
jgi:hypothetical protein